MSELLLHVAGIVASHSKNAYLVGGAVRDMWLKRPSSDLDFAVGSDAIALAYRLADRLRAPVFVLDQERGSARVVLRAEMATIDIATLNEAGIAADLHDRDFTINALAIDCHDLDLQSTIDLHDGISDLRSGLIRPVGADSVRNDPVRALRAIRLACELDLELSAETAEAIAGVLSLLRQSAAERIRAELVRLLDSGRASKGIELMVESGLLGQLLHGTEASAQLEKRTQLITLLDGIADLEQQIAGQLPDWNLPQKVCQSLGKLAQELDDYLSRKVEDGVRGSTLLRMAVLLDSVGEGSGDSERVAKAMRGLKFSSDSSLHVARTVAARKWIGFSGISVPLPDRRSIYRYFQAYYASGVDAALLQLLDGIGPDRGKNWPEVAISLLDAYFTGYGEVVEPELLLNGTDLMNQLNLKPGPIVGRILASLREEQASGNCQSVAEALDLARSIQSEAR